MKARHTRIALVGLACAAILGPGSTAASAGTKPKPKCLSTLVSLDRPSADRIGLQLYMQTMCGRRVGIPVG